MTSENTGPSEPNVTAQAFAPRDLIERLIRRWRLVTACAVLGFAAGIAYGLLAPKWYAATLTVLPSQRSPEPASTLTARMVGLDAGQTTINRIEAVLLSNSVTDKVIEKFDLQKRYGTSHIEHARQALWGHCATSVDKKSGVVSLACEDRDPATAMQMAAYFGEIGNQVFGRISASSAREERAFLETQAAKARAEVEDTSQKLRAFQELHKIIDLPEQSKAVISAMASIQGDMLSKQLELSYLTSFSSRTESSVVQLQRQIEIMQSKLKQLESTAPTASVAKDGKREDFFPNALEVPELRFELERLVREQKIAETVFMLLRQRFETARVDEARDTSTFQILDHPTLPTYKSRPRRVRAVALGGLAGFALAAVIVLVPGFIRMRNRDTRRASVTRADG